MIAATLILTSTLISSLHIGMSLCEKPEAPQALDLGLVYRGVATSISMEWPTPCRSQTSPKWVVSLREKLPTKTRPSAGVNYSDRGRVERPHRTSQVHGIFGMAFPAIFAKHSFEVRVSVATVVVAKLVCLLPNCFLSTMCGAI